MSAVSCAKLGGHDRTLALVFLHAAVRLTAGEWCRRAAKPVLTHATANATTSKLVLLPRKRVRSSDPIRTSDLRPGHVWGRVAARTNAQL
jgi:hypothetical protein